TSVPVGSSKRWNPAAQPFSGDHVSPEWLTISHSIRSWRSSSETWHDRNCAFTGLLCISGNQSSLIQPGRPAFLHRAGLLPQRVNTVATQVLMHVVALKQMVHPSMLRMRLVQKLTRFEAYDFEPGVSQQVLDLHRHVFTIVPGLSLLALAARPDISREE